MREHGSGVAFSLRMPNSHEMAVDDEGRRVFGQTRGTRGRGGKKKESRKGGLPALEGDLRKALGRSFLRWEKDNM